MVKGVTGRPRDWGFKSLQGKVYVFMTDRRRVKLLSPAKIGAVWLDSPRSVQPISGSIPSKQVSDVFMPK